MAGGKRQGTGGAAARIARGAPRTEDELHAWIRERLGLVIPRTSVCPHHDAPFRYIWAAYHDERDVVVWAPRGGGKTTLGAVATLLDLVHKPTCEVRILGGSLEQSLRMWEQLAPMLERTAEKRIEGKLRARSVRMKNGSGVSVLTQSQRTVRGQRVQRLRCDEVELFDREVWNAAQLVTRSRDEAEVERLKGGRRARAIRASIEVLSTMHKPHGLMQEIVDNAQEAGREIIKWCVLDVIEKCVGRDCGQCALQSECGGAARRADGYMRIDDLIRMKKRVGRETWEAEMLCLRPSLQDAVFPDFAPERHVSDKEFWDDETGVQRTLAIDFGFNNPFVCLWIRHDVAGRVYVMDEWVKVRQTVAQHLEVIRQRHPGYEEVACDPAGNRVNSQTSSSDVQLLRTAGLSVHTRGTKIVDGVTKIRAALTPATGEPTLRIHTRCKQLIRSFEGYHYVRGTESPDKDNVHDHCIDALRYFYMNCLKTWSPAKSY